MAKERIGVLGGTFDPFHLGHIAMAKAALTGAKLDRVLVIPTGNPPHKSGVSPAEDRWRMICAALANEDGLVPDRTELDRDGVIYTVDTLRILHERFPKAELFYLIGADTLFELKNWRTYEEVLKLTTFLICPRPWDAQPAELTAERRRLEGLGGRFMNVTMPIVDISSTQLRNALLNGAPTPQLPVVCREYAQLAGLYGLTPRYPDAPVWLEKLFAAMNVRRFAHTLGVANTARHLAAVHGEDIAKAEIAGVLHDCAKDFPVKEMKRIALENNLISDATMLDSGALMHGPVGAWVAKTEYGVADEAISLAIARHTTGCPGMTRLDMIVSLADKIEPGRKKYPALDSVRVLAQLDLRKAMIASMEGTQEYVHKSGRQAHPQSMETIAWLKKN